jgi:glycine betaine/proline transport system permease protein
LGLRQADAAAIEAADAFGATAAQRLWRVELPLALPAIMTGVNQATMMALSMVVVAAMIGARGLGEEVLLGIQRLDVGRGLIAGVVIVLLAVVMDRTTQGIGRRLAGRP